MITSAHMVANLKLVMAHSSSGIAGVNTWSSLPLEVKPSPLFRIHLVEYSLIVTKDFLEKAHGSYYLVIQFFMLNM